MKSVVTVAWELLCVFADFGIPKILQCDNDIAFFNSIMEEMRKAVGFQSRAVMRYFPQQNRAVERFVAETKRLLLKLLRDDMSAWERLVPVMQMSLNDRVLSWHGSSPFAVMFARKLNGFRDFRGIEAEPLSLDEMIQRNREMIEVIFPATAEQSKQKGQARCDIANAQRQKKHTIRQMMKMVDVRNSKLQQ